MYHIRIKPISTNQAWRGRRFKTALYEAYETELYYLLPKLIFPKTNIRLSFEFGLPKAQDIDSPLKQTIDVMCKKYSFDDRHIEELHVWKKVVNRGREYIQFDVSSL